MTSALVGSARIEITGDLSNLASDLESQMSDAFSGMQEAIDSQFAALVDSFGSAGGDAGQAFTDQAAGAITGTATTDAVTQGADAASNTAASAWSSVGDAAGSAFGDTATTAIAGVGADAVSTGADDASTTAVEAWGSVGDSAGGAFGDAATTALSDSSDALSAAADDIASGLDPGSFGDAGAAAGDAYSSGVSDTVSSPDSGVVTAIPQAMDEGRPLAVAAATSIGVESGEAASVKMKEGGAAAGMIFGKSMREALLAVKGTVLAGIGVLGAAELVKGSIEAADESQQAAFKTKNVFGDSAEVITSWSEGAVKKLRETSDAAQLTADAYGQFFHGLGVGQEQAAPMAEKLTELTANVAAFNNVSQSSVQSAFQAALKGRTGGLRALGITVDATTLKHEAMKHADEMGQLQMKKGEPVLTTQQKGLAAYYALLDQTTNQTHAMADTANTARGKQAELSAQFGEVETKIGKGLLPVLSALTGFLLADIVPAIEMTVHWIQENSSWLKPLIEILGGAFIAYKVLHGAVKAGEAIYRSYLEVSKLVALATDHFGITSGRAAEMQGRLDRANKVTKASTEESGAAATVAATETETAAGTAAAARETEAGAATTSAATIAEANTTATTSDEAMAAANDEAAAQFGLGEEAKAAAAEASSARIVTANEAAAASSAEAGGVGAAAGGEAAVGGAAAGAEGAGIGSLVAAAAPLLAVGAAVVGIGAAINHLDGDYAKWQRLQNEEGSFKNIGKDAKTFAEAIHADGDALGQTTERMIITAAQSNGLGDSFGKAGISLADLTTGVTGSNSQFDTMLTTWKNSQHPSAELITKLDTMRLSYLKGKDAAAKATQQQLALNSAINSLKPPEPLHYKVIDDASKTIGVIKGELLGLDGRVVRATVEISATGKGAEFMQSGGSHGAINFATKARGGPLGEGYTVVGEEGFEILHKSGPNVDVINNRDSMSRMSAAGAPPAADGGGGLSAEDRALLREIANRPVYVMLPDKRVLAQAVNDGQLALARR